MTRVFNFAPGPAVLPEVVLQQAQQELLDWQGQGFSVMETSHRTEPFMAMMSETESLMRELLAVPSNYRVLFMQGGGHQQFPMVPINLLRAKIDADYIINGHWSDKAAEEARRFCKVNVAADTLVQGAKRAPQQSELALNPDAAYVYYCSNETIHGVEFDYVPQTNGVPLVVDASSHFLSRPMDVAAHGLIYACAQKNFGPAGLTAVIIRDDLIGHASNRWPTMLDYKTYADNQSLWNTPATFAIYIAHKVLLWLRAQGGLAAIERANIEKATLLYQTIDQSGGFYRNDIEVRQRSRMNVPFSLKDERLNQPFLDAAAAQGLVQLKGHRAVGGMRASIYNAMPLAGVKALSHFMQEFQRRHG